MFCEKLKSLREEKGLTQNDLAKEIYISSDLITQYENGTICPSKENIEKIAVFFEKRIEDIIEDSEETLEVVDYKVITKKLNFVCLKITAIISFLISVFVFIPILPMARPIIPIELGPHLTYKMEYYNESLFHAAYYRTGSFIGVFISLLALITCAFAILSIVYKGKRYTPFLKLASYLLLFTDLVLIFLVFPFHIATF